jgi:AcrR family transcriptional regulator
MAPRPDVSKERKAQIIDAATKVFTERGFSHARMDDIVAESGLSKGTLYWYFDSKESIIVSILDRVFDWETARMRTILAGEQSAHEKLDEIVRITVEDLDRISPLMPIFFEFWSLSFRNATINKTITRYYRKFIDLIEPILEQGIEQGDFRSVPVRETAISIGAIFEGTILMWAYFADVIEFQRQFEVNLDLLLKGLEMRTGASR